VAACDSPVLVHSDRELRLLDLMRSGRLRSSRTPSVSDLISASGSGSDGRGEMGGGLTVVARFPVRCIAGSFQRRHSGDPWHWGEGERGSACCGGVGGVVFVTDLV
jgi:hypothetical protein